MCEIKSKYSSILEEVSSKEALMFAIEHVRKKTKNNKSKLNSSPNKKNQSLRWLLSDNAFVIKNISKQIREKKYLPSPPRLNEVYIDKKRTLFSRTWPDRVVECAFTKALESRLNHLLSKRVFSYRSGYSHHLAVNECAEFISSNSEIYIAKRDIKSYADSIETKKMYEMLCNLLPGEESYFYKLLKAFVWPEYIHGNSNATAHMCNGLTLGTHISCLCMNLFIYELDLAMENKKGLFYCRFGDDILFGHKSAEAISNCVLEAESFLQKKNLCFKKSKKFDALLKDKTQSLDYLGFNISKEGALFISKKRQQKLKKSVRSWVKYSFFAKRKYFSNNKADKKELAQNLCKSLDIFFSRRLTDPTFQTVLKFSTNDEALKKLDVWIAKQAIAPVYGSSQDSVFKKMSLAEIREAGLHSIIHRKNLSHRNKHLK